MPLVSLHARQAEGHQSPAQNNEQDAATRVGPVHSGLPMRVQFKMMLSRFDVAHQTHHVVVVCVFRVEGDGRRR